ncbi:MULTISPECIES: DHA2 family efflux MFS transporter permease subunit [Dysgonomonas]|uniref:DHA2 family efflux MFS transporter permease subunit n=1 Tax=Dysgonomonas TaxID=156973 RepID=UPI00092CD1F7|nr:MULTISPECIES: DHA2 family efflux MFS transporter permease subunit [Dysgonomonas]MBN9302370.1 DHA2 family efflux MFS transporter permease subunit [Dysgonomonas mossii]MBS5795977.1 DHA2 family efflux MFS transporter permease subunit [Dysgonomonas mossii]MBS7111112.1 DHA2 family efflux MFS transporter permease subunit [Dysgonomonas mossii]OJX64287.1 MAG: drug:proton antiporter [Dysgonomonas sp. 37-18]
MKIDKTYTVSLVVAIAFFMQGLDTTAVNTAIPAMARSFNTDVVHLSAGITSYLIALAIFIPVSGWIADRYGTRRVFCTSIVLFITASALCGMSQTLTQFVIFRIFQGMAGAMMTPVGRLAVLKSVTKDKLVTAMAYIVWPALVAPILGPVVGGYLTTYWTWHWIFYLNIPISIICVILAWRFIPEEEKNNLPKKRFDLVGFVLSGSALVGFMYGVELLSRREVPYYVSVLLILVSICLLLFNVRYSKHISNPLIDYSVIRIPTYKVTIFTGSISRMVIGVAPYLIPLMFQEGFGLNPFESGSLFLATMAGNLAMKPATIWVMRHYNFRTVLVVNGFLVALFSFFTALLLPTTPVVLIVVVMFLSGMFRSMQFSAITTLAFAEIPQQQMTAANTLYSTVQQMSTGMGIAMGAVFLRFSNMINGYSEHYTVADFRLAFIFVAILGIVSLYGFTKLTPDAGDAVRVKKRDRNVG